MEAVWTRWALKVGEGLKEAQGRGRPGADTGPLGEWSGGGGLKGREGPGWPGVCVQRRAAVRGPSEPYFKGRESGGAGQVS